MRVFFKPDTANLSNGPVHSWTETDTEQTIAGLESVLHYGDIKFGDIVVDRLVVSVVETVSKLDLKMELASIRYTHEVGGVTPYFDLPGIPDGYYPFDTSRESYALISGTLGQFQETAFNFIRWKLRDGSFLTMDAVAFTYMAFAVRDHVRFAFEAEADVSAQIDAATDLSALDIKAAYFAAYDALVLSA